MLLDRDTIINEKIMIGMCASLMGSSLKDTIL